MPSVAAYKTIRDELEAYGHGLSDKPEILALNKIDAIPKALIARKRAALEKASGRPVFLLSGVSGEGVSGVLRKLADEVEKRRAEKRHGPKPALAWSP